MELYIGANVRYVPPNSEIGGPGKSVTDILRPLNTSEIYKVRDIDARPEEVYGFRLVRLEGIENPVRRTIYGQIEIGYRSDAFRLIE